MDGSMTLAPTTRSGSPFLSTKQAADYVGLSPRTLEKMRVVGGGPTYRKHGRYVRYHIDDLSGWSTSNAHHSTSEPPPQLAATVPTARLRSSSMRGGAQSVTADA